MSQTSLAPVTLLAFDTSGAPGSVALDNRGSIVARAALDEPREHASALVPAIDAVLREASMCRQDLGGVVVGEGPGSFTGVRVAAATAKGLVHALGLPLWAVSSLRAAAMVSDVGPVRYVLFDARGDRVYGACFGIGQVGVEELVPPHGGTLREALAGDVPAGAVFVGDGSIRHRAAVEAAGFPVDSSPADPLAVGLLRYVSLDRAHRPVPDPSTWEPTYIRASSAERLWTA